jgi:hypothetical protein
VTSLSSAIADGTLFVRGRAQLFAIKLADAMGSQNRVRTSSSPALRSERFRVCLTAE